MGNALDTAGAIDFAAAKAWGARHHPSIEFSACLTRTPISERNTTPHTERRIARMPVAAQRSGDGYTARPPGIDRPSAEPGGGCASTASHPEISRPFWNRRTIAVPSAAAYSTWKVTTEDLPPYTLTTTMLVAQARRAVAVASVASYARAATMPWRTCRMMKLFCKRLSLTSRISG